MRNRTFEGRDEQSYNEPPRGFSSEMGHERGFGMANGRDGGFDRDPHRVDVHRYGGRDDAMWSRYDYANDPGNRSLGNGFAGQERREQVNDFGVCTSGYAPAHFERARGQYEGVHAPRQGRLPKGYTRSDERIREDVCERLGAVLDASEVEVRVDDGVVSLTGSVFDRQTKYLLEEVCERALGVKDVQNHVTILRGAGNSLASTQRMDIGDGPRHSRH